MKYLQNINCFMRIRHHIIVLYIIILNFNALTIGIHEISSENYGWLRPSGKIIRRVGQNLEIFCGINTETSETKNNHFTTENLEFRGVGRLLDPQYVTNVNETTICLFLSNENESDNTYECFLTGNKTKSLPMVFQNIGINAPKIEDTNFNISNRKSSTPDGSDRFQISIGSIQVQVGEKPKEVLNFRCVLYHWSTLKCLWNLRENLVQTNYSIQYIPINSMKSENSATSINSALRDSTISINPAKCPNDDDRMMNQCIWSPLTKPQYLNMHRELNVTIIGANMFGQVEQSFIFNQLEHMRPEEVSGLHIQEVTSTSFELRWSINNVVDVTGKRTYEVQYCYARHTGCDWLILPITWIGRSEQHGLYSLNCSGLTPNTIHRLRIRNKLSQARAFDEYWSDYTYIDVKTRPRRAAHIPETDVGLFQILDPKESKDTHSRWVKIYCKSIVLSPEYGDFHYEVKFSQVDENGTSDKQLFTKWYNFSAEYAPTFALGPSGYHLVIRSANSEGGAPNTSFINVPATNNTAKSCAFFYAIMRINLNKTYTFECFWKPPKEQPGIVNYTLFWYWYLRDSNEQTISNSTKRHWTYLPANITRYQILIDYNHYSNTTISMKWMYMYDICISVNTEHSSSGLYCIKFPVFSISDAVRTKYFSQLINKSTVQHPPKRHTYNGWKFSHDQFQKWMDKLYTVEP